MKTWIDNTEEKLCNNPTSKKFYGYVNGKFNTRSNIPPLLDDDNNLCLTDEDKADLLNRCFEQNFVIDDGEDPIVNTDPLPCFMEDFVINESDILHALQKVPNKFVKNA